MFCAISGEVPQEPVVAKTTGLLFEKRIILQALKLEKKCPVTNTDLSEENLLPIAANPIPPLRVAAPTNVNGLLHTLQQEWDETVLETFNLRQQLDTTRRELSHALYQYDAACRVIARLVKERDEAFNLLKTYQLNGYVAATNGEGSSQPQQSTTETEEAMDVVQTEVGISPEIVNELNALCKQLSSGRKQRKPSEHLTTKDQMAQLHEVGQYAPHKNVITAVAVKASSDNNSNLVLSGSADSSVVLSDLDSGKVHCKLNGHRGVVNTIAFSPVSADTLFSGSDDKTVRIWHASGEGNYTQRYQLAHQSAVTGLTVQPSGNYLVTTAESGNWNVFDVKNGILLKSVADVDNTQYKTCCFHPDGLILGTGTKQGSFKIWDIREQKEVTTLKESDGSIQSISFSENGYFTATGHSNGEVIIWDLRKLAKVKSFNVGSSPVNSVSFDYSGVYLGIGGGGVAGSQLEVKVVKDWSSLVTIPNAHNAEVTGIAWTNHAGSLVSASVDQTIRVFGK